MNDLRLMHILKVAVANICDLSNGYKASTDTLWDMYGELEQAIQEKQKAIGDLAELIAKDLMEGHFIFHSMNDDSKERQRQVVNRIYRTIAEN